MIVLAAPVGRCPGGGVATKVAAQQALKATRKDFLKRGMTALDLPSDGQNARRAVDKATGSNMSGANPSHSTPASRERAHERKHDDKTGNTTR